MLLPLFIGSGGISIRTDESDIKKKVASRPIAGEIKSFRGAAFPRGVEMTITLTFDATSVVP